MDKAYNLIDFRENEYSQCGEDGILSKILTDLKIDKGWFVEFGAWDGERLSNTKRLANAGWQGVFIEGDPVKYEDLKKNYQGDESMHLLCAMVGSYGENALDVLLKDTPLPEEFDVLSIDIDGDDYNVWRALNDYKPKVVVIESNPTFPYNIEFVQNEGESIGNSALSLYKLGLEKGYSIVCYNVHNCIFVRSDLVKKLNLYDSSFAYLFHLGRQGSAGGYFASDQPGVWYWLHPEMISWGVEWVDHPIKHLSEGRYLRGFIGKNIRMLKQIISTNIRILKQIVRPKSSSKDLNQGIRERAQQFKYLEGKEVVSLFDKNRPS